MYLQRTVEAFLEEWKADQKKKPLIIKENRQIGKQNPFCIEVGDFLLDRYLKTS